MSFKAAKVGNVPTSWHVEELKFFLDLITYGFTNPMPDAIEGPWKLTAKDVVDGRINYATARRTTLRAFTSSLTDKSRPKLGDVLLTKDGSIGRVAVVDREGICINQSVALLRPNQFIDPYFLKYLLFSPYYQSVMEGDSDGSTIKHIYITRVDKMQVAVPPLVEQKAILEVIGSIDDRISLLRETNTTLEAIAQALFKSWFVDFDPVRAKQQGSEPQGMDAATAALFPDSFEDSELGEVPTGWWATTMGEVSTVGIGKTPPRKEPQWFSECANDIRWVSIRDMGVSGVFASQTNEFLTQEAIQRFNVRVVPDNTTILSFKMTIGRVAITDGEMTTNEAIAHFKLGEASQLSSEFIYLHLKLFNYASLSSTSSIADAVNSKTVRNIPILVPSANVLRAFQHSVKPLFEKLKVMEKQAQTLATLRDTLLPRLISGQLRLPA